MAQAKENPEPPAGGIRADEHEAGKRSYNSDAAVIQASRIALQCGVPLHVAVLIASHAFPAPVYG
jgi:hypothetical protein